MPDGAPRPVPVDSDPGRSGSGAAGFQRRRPARGAPHPLSGRQGRFPSCVRCRRKLRRIHTLRTARTADDRSVLVLRGSHGRQLLPEPLLRDEPVAQRRQPARSAVASGGRTFGDGPLSVPLPLRPQLLHIQLYLFVLRLERLGARTRLDGPERRQSHARPPWGPNSSGPERWKTPDLPKRRSATSSRGRLSRHGGSWAISKDGAAR